MAYRGSLFIDVDMRIAAMDAAGIRVQALSPNPLTFLHFIDAPAAVDFCRAHNDSLAEVVADHPDRFVGLGALPMQDIGAACAELRRIVADLGLLGGFVGTDFGTPLDAPAVDALYELCVELDVPLFLHPTQSGIDGPLLDERLRRWDLDLVLEYSFEEALAAATLIFGGVLRRHPRPGRLPEPRRGIPGPDAVEAAQAGRAAPRFAGVVEARGRLRHAARTALVRLPRDRAGGVSPS